MKKTEMEMESEECRDGEKVFSACYSFAVCVADDE